MFRSLHKRYIGLLSPSPNARNISGYSHLLKLFNEQNQGPAGTGYMLLYFKNYLFFNFWGYTGSQLRHVGSLAAALKLLVSACGIQFLDQGSNPGPLHWKRGALTAGPAGKALFIYFLMACMSQEKETWASVEQAGTDHEVTDQW